ncbi:MAG: ureidoglycolate lyase, partial [Pyrinomonadaceae bacterium]
MRIICLSPQEMTRAAFAPYGVLLDERGSVELDLGGGVPSMTGATSERRPFRFDFMARHRQTMQVFSPLVESRSIICVAPPNAGRAPDPEAVVAFLGAASFGAV